MPKLPQISGRELVKIFKKDGWIEAGQKGSHLKIVRFHKPVGKSVLIIPLHKVIKKGTLSNILKEGGLSVQKLQKLQ